MAESPLELVQTLDTISFTINQQKQITSKSLQAVTAIIAHWSCPIHTQAYAPAHTRAHTWQRHTHTYSTHTDTEYRRSSSHTQMLVRNQIHCRDFCPINMHAKQFRTQQDVFVSLLQGNLALLFPHKLATEGGEARSEEGLEKWNGFLD